LNKVIMPGAQAQSSAFRCSYVTPVWASLAMCSRLGVSTSPESGQLAGRLGRPA